MVLRKDHRHQKPQNERELHAAMARGEIVLAPRHGAPNHSVGPSNAAKLEAEDADFRHASLGHDFKIALQKARQAKNLSQKDLALKINVKQSILTEYEQGKAIPDPQIISKLNRVLGIKLPKPIKPKKKAEE